MIEREISPIQKFRECKLIKNNKIFLEAQIEFQNIQWFLKQCKIRQMRQNKQTHINSAKCCKVTQIMPSLTVTQTHKAALSE